MTSAHWCGQSPAARTDDNLGAAAPSRDIPTRSPRLACPHCSQRSWDRSPHLDARHSPLPSAALRDHGLDEPVLGRRPTLTARRARRRVGPRHVVCTGFDDIPAFAALPMLLRQVLDKADLHSLSTLITPVFRAADSLESGRLKHPLEVALELRVTRKFGVIGHSRATHRRVVGRSRATTAGE